jgi:hypothetical protein
MRSHPQRYSAAELQQLSGNSNGAAVREPEVESALGRLRSPEQNDFEADRAKILMMSAEISCLAPHHIPGVPILIRRCTIGTERQRNSEWDHLGKGG